MTAIPRELRTPDELRSAMGTDWAPSAQQWAAITAPLSPSVVIAGAGSGKTSLMAARVVYLVVTGQVRPEEVLGLTFTTKAAGELRQRIRDALLAAGAISEATSVRDDDVDALEPTVSTYNAYAANLLAEHGLRIGHEPETRVITDASRYQLGARAVERFTGEIELLSDHPPTVIQNLLALDGAMSEHLVTADDVRAADAEAGAGFASAIAEERAGKDRKTYREASEKALHAVERRGELLQLVTSYRRLKADLGLMDFSDQISLGARLAEEHPDVGALERQRFKVVLLDEYQDTSVAQARMLAHLFSGADAASGRGHAVTAVGDPNQAIYGWRGASVSNILDFPQTFPAVTDEVPVLPLTVNRRSDRTILSVANALADPLYAATSMVRPLEPKPGALAGRVAARVFETQDGELAWLAGAVGDAHTGLWSDIGVLTRDNATAESVFDTLTAVGIPVEIVGLSGLLRLPEVAEIVAMLELLHDVTANTAVLTLLSGPRWAIGPRDLRLLRERAAELAGRRGRTESATIGDQLTEIADGIDPAELPALSDALADPGRGPYSAEALERFALLAAELRSLRSYAGEPILDVVRRIVDTTGIDIELASAVSPAAAARRDNVDLFLKAVAEFQAIDGDVTLPALLAYLTAEDDQGNGLDIATPTEADSVKLLTVHRAKGLEWDSVFLVGVCETRFPSNRSRTLWTSSPSVLPAPLRGDAHDQPQLRGWDKAALDAYRADTREHDRIEELRLAYVAFTRAAHRLEVSSYLWSPRATPFGPSEYQRLVAGLADQLDLEVDWLDKPEKGAANPYAATDVATPWPVSGVGREAALRRQAAELVRGSAVDGDDADLDLVESARVEEWDVELDRLLVEARADRAEVLDVPLPTSLSATAVARLREDPEAFAGELARPMPRQPSPAARFGTRFHAWVEARFGQQSLLDPDDLPGRGDLGIDDEDDLRELITRFESGPFGERVPHAVEAPFALVLAGQVVRGRMDAVYAEPDGGWLVIDWKTNRRQTADPLQLALYRLAWAELHDVPLDRVSAGFHYVRTGETVLPEDLPDRAALAELLKSTTPV
ncbi:ATP-dependent DNA helicase [Marmoricola sp. URHB0036]|uniref:ATP-dependent helicase n=1 Tax=Marmoricola sp. URHB0036 TaxID=1298863 RepID=UPI00040FECC7|nr:ATP-dependent DNA helicase [Marmoricola sp. URHB0036]